MMSHSPSPNVIRLRRCFASGRLVHPYLPAWHFSGDRREDHERRHQQRRRPRGDRSGSDAVEGGGGAEAEAEAGRRGGTEDGDDDGAPPSSRDDSDADATVVANFADLSSALALCCGVRVGAAATGAAGTDADTSGGGGCDNSANGATSTGGAAERIAAEIGGLDRRHVVFVLCDGMGTNVMRRHLMKSPRPSSSSPDGSDEEERDPRLPFLVRNDRARGSRPPLSLSLRAVFPSTTPAALTTLATAAWPGRHGVPGWDLRDVARCEFPGSGGGGYRHGEGAASDGLGLGGGGPVQIRILADRVTDYRSGRPLREAAPEFYAGNEEQGKHTDRIFVEEPWVRKLDDCERVDDVGIGDEKGRRRRRRRMLFVNAYNGDEFPSWYQRQRSHRSPESDDGRSEVGREGEGKETATEFSAWQQRRPDARAPGREGRQQVSHDDDDGDDVGSCGEPDRYGLLETFKIPETSFDTLGEPEGSAAAVEYFRRGVNATLRFVAEGERRGRSTYTYVYTAHPDKHMHALGVDHDEVGRVVRGIDRELERLWRVLGDRRLLLSTYGDPDGDGDGETSGRIDGGDVGKQSDGHPAMSSGDRGDNGGGSNGGVTDGTERVDAALVVTADHGHVTVEPEEMVELTEDILECLEYANIGVHGKGRHAYLHCRSGYRTILPDRWGAADDGAIAADFLLLTADEAAGEGLFGPVPPRTEVRPRIGDFVAIALGRRTLVTPREADRYRYGYARGCGDGDGDGAPPAARGRRQGAHGSLLPDEMEIPFVLCTP